MHFPENVCRFCAQLHETTHYIFDKSRNLEEKIKKYLKITVSNNDFKPKQICNNCYNKLNELSEFVELCKVTDKKLESSLIQIMQKNWQPCGGSTYFVRPQQKISVIVTCKPPDVFTENDVALHKGNVIPVGEYNCSRQSAVVAPLNNYSASYGTKQHCTAVQEYSNNCPINDQEIIDIVQNTVDYDTITPIPEDMTFIAAPNYEGKRYETDYCISNNNSVVQHSSNYIISDYCMDNNSYTYTNQNRNVLNMSEPNYNEQAVNFNNTCRNKNSYIPPCSPCSSNEIIDCSRTYVTKSNRNPLKNNEIITVNEIKELVATVQTDYKKKKPSEGKMFVCPLKDCKKTFVRQLTLKAHTSMHSQSTKSFTCAVCGKIFALKSDLNNHQKTHNDNHKCKICMKSFQVPSKLERHMRIHTKQKPFVCTYKFCGKAFSDKRNLDSHKTSHSNDRNFKCDLCAKTYKTKSQLKEHAKTHGEVGVYKCGICSKSYKWKANLINHKKSHTDYTCSFCNEKYGTFSKLSKHRKECREKFNHN